MNKAITDGIVFQPTSFSEGLNVWSSQDGTPGSNTYASATNAAFVPADQDFGGCLELQKVSSTTKVRYMGQTPISPGCYLLIKARVKLISGAFPSVRIAGWAGRNDASQLRGVVQTGPSVALSSYGEVTEVRAIVGSGNRGGVDMAWGKDAAYGHFGLDFTGPNGGIVRVDDLTIEDISTMYADELVGAVDVRDFGAIGDGVADDHDAFEAADDAANGREVLVPEGTFFIGGSITFQNRVRFVGKINMPDDARLTLLKDFNLPSYIDAFDDEVLAFKKAFQSLLNYNDHESLDMGGRRIQLTEPLDLQAAVNNRTEFNTRRVVRNGMFQADPSTAWDSETTTSPGTYDNSNGLKLTNVTNAANVLQGSLITGAGVGREIYVTSVDIGAQEITLSRPLFDAEGTQTYTFTRHKYMLDFSGFDKNSYMQFDDVEFLGNNRASHVILPNAGLNFHFRDCHFNKPNHRCVTSPGSGCQGMMFDRCQFLSAESSLRVQDRISICFNSNKNDIKIRDCRIQHFRHFGVIAGTGSVISGNHWFHGDGETDGERVAGLIFTRPNAVALITSNYIDNNYIEWTNEHDSTPDFSNQYSFGGMTITGNIFLSIDVAPWFNFVVIKPYGTGHTLSGFNMSGNVFRMFAGNIDRVEGVNTTYADLDRTRFKNVVVQGNTYSGINQPIFNPCTLEHNEASDNSIWTMDFAPHLPFQAETRVVESVVPKDKIQSGGSIVGDMPYALTGVGPNGDQIKLGWQQPSRGKVMVTARCDNPT